MLNECWMPQIYKLSITLKERPNKFKNKVLSLDIIFNRQILLYIVYIWCEYYLKFLLSIRLVYGLYFLRFSGFILYPLSFFLYSPFKLKKFKRTKFCLIESLKEVNIQLTFTRIFFYVNKTNLEYVWLNK